MKPWSASIGATNAASEKPVISVTTVAADRLRRREPYIEELRGCCRRSVFEEEVEDGVGEKAEDQIIEPEDRQPAPGERLGARRGEGGRQRLRRADHHGQQQRQG